MKNNKIDIATIDKVYVGIDEEIQDSNLSSQIGTESEQYRCENCSSEDIIAKGTRDYKQYELHICCCNCGQCEDGVDAYRESVLDCTVWRSGRLDKNKDIVWVESGTDILDKDILKCDVCCQKCYEESGLEDWQYIHGEVEYDSDSNKTEISCQSCDHESDFPWSYFE